jgi:uncharacterized membrane protein required for colicin V production
VYIAIDVLLAVVVIYCMWRGYRSGVIRGVCGTLALVAAIFGANIAASAYSGEISVMLRPFVGGIVDGALSSLANGGDEAPGVADEDGELLWDKIPSVLSPGESDGESLRAASYAALRKIGLPDAPAALIADKISGGEFESGTSLADVISDKLCSALAYIAVFGVVFLLVSIIAAVIGNVLNLVFKLPGLEFLDSMVGLVFGLAKGVVIIYAAAAVIRYIGLLAPSIIEQTSVLKHLVNTNPLANILGI